MCDASRRSKLKVSGGGAPDGGAPASPAAAASSLELRDGSASRACRASAVSGLLKETCAQ